MVEAFFAGGALNRTFSAGGAPGIVLRVMFLRRQNVSMGAVGVIYLIEDIAGVIVGGCIFLVGLLALENTEPSVFINRAAVAFAVGAALLAPFCVYLIRDRAGVERISHSLARLRLHPPAGSVRAWVSYHPPAANERHNRAGIRWF